VIHFFTASGLCCAGNRMQTLANKRTFLKRRFVVRLKCSPNIPEQSSPMFACSPKKFAKRTASRTGGHRDKSAHANAA
jgi:hypothetical protein